MAGPENRSLSRSVSPTRGSQRLSLGPIGQLGLQSPRRASRC
jgi:hypothetical protein